MILTQNSNKNLLLISGEIFIIIIVFYCYLASLFYLCIYNIIYFIMEHFFIETLELN